VAAGWAIADEWKGMWKEAVVASLYVYRRHLCGGTEEDGGLFHDKRSAGRALNTSPPAHEAGLPTV